MIKILYEDNDVIVAVKPPGMESQSAHSFQPDMVSEIKKHLSTKKSTNQSTMGKEPYVGVIHRLDKPVGGVMVYGKNQKAAASLSRQVQNRQMEKHYLAVICGKPVDNVGNYVDYLLKEGKTNVSRIVDKSVEEAKRAELSYQVLAEKEENGKLYTLVDVELLTGRHHQIRVQFAGRNTPLLGDMKYGDSKERTVGLCLFSSRLSFIHPVTGKRMEFEEKPAGAQWSGYIK